MTADVPTRSRGHLRRRRRHARADAVRLHRLPVNEVVIVGETGSSAMRLSRRPTRPRRDAAGRRARPAAAARRLDHRRRCSTCRTSATRSANFVGSQGFVHEAAAVQDAISKGLLEHPEMPLDETLAMARIFEKIRAQIGLTYPWDEEGEGAAKKARR